MVIAPECPQRITNTGSTELGLPCHLYAALHAPRTGTSGAESSGVPWDAGAECRFLVARQMKDRPMRSGDIRALQAPLKERYRGNPEAALLTLRAEGTLGEGLACSVDTGKALVEAGLHPATGGSGLQACSGDMLLQALVACAGVTLSAVATALEIPIQNGRVRAEGDLDFRGTLGLSKEVPVGFSEIRVRFNLESSASPEQLAKLIELTERYCVVLQTLRAPVNVKATVGG